MSHYNTYYMGFSEINLDTLSKKITRQIKDTVKNQFRHSKTTLASLTILVTNNYKPGGNMSIVQNNLVGRIIENGQDAMGEWVYVKLAANDDSFVMVITAY
eukprot:4241101-Ditylum_brightwellii.AAC.1